MKVFRSINTAIFSLALVLSIPITVFLIHNQQDIRQHAASSPTLLEYGFNTHISTSNNGLTFSQFQSDVDDMVSNKQKWIRFNILDWEVASENKSQQVTHITWNSQNLAVYDQAINYAASKGLKIFLVTNAPEFASKYSDADYLRISLEYYSYLANRYKGKISIWQVFNEINVHNYRTYAPIVALSSSDLAKFNVFLSNIRFDIKSIDPNTLVTTNAGGFPVNDALMNSWNTFFDGIKNSIDVISVDFYPNTDTAEIQKLADRIGTLRARYGKDVYVAEFGMCTGSFSEADQVNYVSQMIQSFQYSPAKAILYYEIRDENTSLGSCENTFGIKKTDGTQKSSYNTIMGNMNNNANPNAPLQLSTGTLRVYTDPAVQATISVVPYSFTRQWSVNWEPLVVGRYYLNFSLSPSNPSVLFPTQYPILIKPQQTTQVTVNTQTGKAVVQYFSSSTDADHGLLRVALNPSVAATITTSAADLSSLTQQWGINWVPLSQGMYTLSFTYPYTTISGNSTKIPPPQTISILSEKTTTIKADLTSGTLTTYTQ